MKQGRLELLMHRRVDGDEQRGVFEHLVEDGSTHRPIFVNSKFALHIFNKKLQRSL